MLITKQEMLDCIGRVEPYVHRTPVMVSEQLDRYIGAKLFFKCENFQRTGSFKMRGATNAVFSIPESGRRRGVVAHSSGNFAQAVAKAALFAGVKAWVVMPSTAPQVKVDAVRGYRGDVVLCEPTVEARQVTARKIAEETGANFLHPSNDLKVIAGQGTVGMELLGEFPDLDYIITPVGGGGLIAGCALAAHYFGEDCHTIGGEPRQADDAFRSMASGSIEHNETADTIADGLRTHLGHLNFPIIQRHVERIICVDELEIAVAMRLIWERMKIIVEPSSAVAFAAIVRDKDEFAGKKIGLVMSGGNVDWEILPFQNQDPAAVAGPSN